MRGRGLTVHLDIDDEGATAVPARVTAAISNATREALSNVAAHAGTGEAWVQVHLMAEPGDAEVPCRLQVTVATAAPASTLPGSNRAGSASGGPLRSAPLIAADGHPSVGTRAGHLVSLSWPAPPRRPTNRVRPDLYWPTGATALPVLRRCALPRAHSGSAVMVSPHAVARDIAEAGLMRMVNGRGGPAVHSAYPGAGQFA